MYAGYMMTHAGFLLIMPTLWNLGVYVVTWALLILRIFAEEKLLSQDPVYRDYAAQVRYRLLPGVF
jgi:protein-S-isoprenylcysteine O-methyltransferase Ste14